MLRLFALVVYLALLYSSGQAKTGGGWDPKGLTTQPPGELGGGPQPAGAQVPPAPGDGGGGLDPDG